MKNIWKTLLFFTVSFVSHGITGADQLSHICAYSNESVVRFRSPMLKKSVSSLDNPGVQFDWPIDLCEFWISSLYGNRVDPAGRKHLHTGVDMAATKGTRVVAAADGVVKAVHALSPKYGNMVEVEHGKGSFVTRYAHLDAIKTQVGKTVKKGNVIGSVGSTGNVRGKDPSHLHFELIKDGKRVNPLHYLYWAEIGYHKSKK